MTVFLEFGSGWESFSTFFKFILTKISCVWLLWTPWAFWDILTLETWNLFPFFFLASLEIQSAYDNHRLLILSTGRDKNFSQRFLRARLYADYVDRFPLTDKCESTAPTPGHEEFVNLKLSHGKPGVEIQEELVSVQCMKWTNKLWC